MWETEVAQCSKVMTKVSHFSDTSRKASSKRKSGWVLWDEIQDENSTVVVKSNIP